MRVQVSKELIAVAITCHEKWFHGLSDASLMFFDHDNEEGQLGLGLGLGLGLNVDGQLSPRRARRKISDATFALLPISIFSHCYSACTDLDCVAGMKNKLDGLYDGWNDEGRTHFGWASVTVSLRPA